MVIHTENFPADYLLLHEQWKQNPSAMNALSIADWNCCQKNWRIAKFWFDEAAKKANTAALYCLSTHSLKIQSQELHRNNALEWSHNNALTAYQFACRFANSNDPLYKQSLDRVFEFASIASFHGLNNPEIRTINQFYLDLGSRLKKPDQESIALTLKTITCWVTKNDPDAAYSIGKWYWRNIFVKEDKLKACEWLTRAAQKGHQKAIEFLNRP
jgi:hypothetical protein